MMRYWTLGILLLAQIAIGELPDQVQKQLGIAAAATGADYLAARDALVNLGSNAVPQLTEMSANTNEPWQIRLMAGIVAERIQRAEGIASLVNKDWRKDPEYNNDWNKDRCGPVIGLAPLVKKRYEETGLIWYHVEMTWKETQEHSKTVRDESWWRAAGRAACTNSVAYDLLVKVLAERIRKDIGFKEYERWDEFNFLMNSQTNTALPFLIEIIPLAPLNSREDAYYKLLKNMAQPQDVPLFEKHFRDKGQDVPLMLREPLRKLKERQSNPDKEII